MENPAERGREPAEAAYYQPVFRPLALIVGVAALACGVTSLVFLGWFLYRVSLVGRIFEPFSMVITVAATAITLFFLPVGYRLAAGRRGQRGSLLSPSGWRALGYVFAALAVVPTAVLLWNRTYSALSGTVCAAAFAWWCFRLANRAANNSGAPDAL
jgi:hypothetical protein